MDIQKGHIYFAIGFMIVFAVILAFVYRKDLKLHKKNYKNSWIIILSVLALLIAFIFLKDTLISL